MRFGNGYYCLLAQGRKVPVTELNAYYALPVGDGLMQELGAAFERLIFKSRCNLSSTLDFSVLVIVVSHPYLQLLKPGNGLVQLT